MSKILLVMQHSAFCGAASREGQDLAMALAATGHQVSVLYRAEAVLQLLPLTRAIAVKDFTKAQKLFEMYDIEAVYVCQQAFTAFGLARHALQIPVSVLSREAQSTLFNQFDQILVT